MCFETRRSSGAKYGFPDGIMSPKYAYVLKNAGCLLLFGSKSENMAANHQRGSPYRLCWEVHAFSTYPFSSISLRITFQ